MKISSVPPGEYIYLIQDRESFRCSDEVYKIGKTTQEPYKRMEGYPKSSILLLTIIVDDCDSAEIDLLKLFGERYIRDIRRGNEYFKGDPVKMIKDILDYQRDHFRVSTLIDRAHERDITIPEDDGLKPKRKCRKCVEVEEYDEVESKSKEKPSKKPKVDRKEKPSKKPKVDRKEKPSKKTKTKPKDKPSKKPVEDSSSSSEYYIYESDSEPSVHSNHDNVNENQYSSNSESEEHTIQTIIFNSHEQPKPKHKPQPQTTTKTIQQRRIVNKQCTTINRIGKIITDITKNPNYGMCIHIIQDRENINNVQIDHIDITNRNRIIQTLYIDDYDESSPLYTCKRLDLTRAQQEKFEFIHDSDISNYVIKVPLLKLKKCLHASYYDMYFMIDE